MPELPEVETVRRGLQAVIEGRRIERVEQRRPDLRFPLPEGFSSRLEGRRIEAVGRRAKYLLIRLDDGVHWLVHLGMSGRFTIEGATGPIPAPLPGPGPSPAPGQASSGQAISGQAGHNSGWAMERKHDHVLVGLEGGIRLVFNDARRFGFMDLIAPAAMPLHPRLKGLGPEPLSEAFDVGYLNAVLAIRRTPIKAALLDQTVVAGIGNIYACEALHRAGISPRRSAHTVAGKRTVRLVPAIRSVLEQAIAAGGSSLRNYVQASGELGYFQHAWQVYDREGGICALEECGGEIRRIVQSGRSTFYCARHQR